MKRTVTDVVPALETNLSGIREVLDSLVKNYKAKEEQFVGFQKEYGISVSLRRMSFQSGELMLTEDRCLDNRDHLDSVITHHYQNCTAGRDGQRMPCITSPKSIAAPNSAGHGHRNS